MNKYNEIIITCGISVKSPNSHFAKIIDDNKNNLSAIDFLLPDGTNLEKISAEYSVLNNLLKTGKLDNEFSITLIITNTDDGILCGNILKRIFQKNLNIKNIEIKDFNIDANKSIQELEKAIPDFIAFIYDKLYNKNKNTTAFIAQGGYKIITAYSYLAASFLGFPLLYIHEDSQKNLLEIPSIPIEIDNNILKKNYTLITKLLEDSTSSQNITNEEIENIKEINFLFELNANKVKLNSIGLFICKKFKESFSFDISNIFDVNKINELKTDNIGINTENKAKDLEWLKSLPKAELHFHFGGSLFPDQIIEVAKTNLINISDTLKNELASIISQHNYLTPYEIENLSKKNNIKFYLLNSYYLVSKFDNNKNDLKNQIFSNLILNNGKNDNQIFNSIGLDEYFKLGNYQGSKLLQTKASIEKTCDFIFEYCKSENIKYIEIRLSPQNCMEGEFMYEKEEQVKDKFKEILDIVTEKINRFEKENKNHGFRANLIIILTRHKESDISKVIEYLIDYIDKNPKHKICAVDLAGIEKQETLPYVFKFAFEALHKRFINLTIHAGETGIEDSVRQAINDLSADRIGHGLFLQDEIIDKIINRNIALEMCPSSNIQTNGYKLFSDKKNKSDATYKLKEYYDKGVKVTINTDNIGISNTTISNEFIIASKLTDGGLNKFDILKIILNGFEASFLKIAERKNFIKNIIDELRQKT